jgi:hypothetical protein
MYRNRLKIGNLNLENFHGSFIESMMKTDSKHREEYDIFDKPYALLRHISESSRFERFRCKKSGSLAKSEKTFTIRKVNHFH